MYHLRREYIADEIEHLLKERNRLIIADAKHICGDSPVAVRRTLLDVFREASEIWICGNRRTHVAGDIHFRNDTDMLGGGICNNLAQFRFRIVKGTILLSVKLALVAEVAKYLEFRAMLRRFLSP